MANITEGFRIEIGVEWYPVVMIRAANEDHPAEEIDPGLMDRYRQALNNFLEVQRDLGNWSLLSDFDPATGTYRWEQED